MNEDIDYTFCLVDNKCIRIRPSNDTLYIVDDDAPNKRFCKRFELYERKKSRKPQLLT